MRLTLEVKHSGAVSLDPSEVARAVAALDSREFVAFMDEVFQHLESICSSSANYEMQLCWISKRKGSFRNAVIALNGFYELEEE